MADDHAAPQTITEVRDLLARHGTAPIRALGQNFLIDGNLMRRLVEEAELDATRDVVLEVGAGTGSLTRMLADRAARVVTVETDKKLTPVLDEALAGRSNVRVLITDALAGKHVIEPAVMTALSNALADVGDNARLKLVANLPYVIATPLVMNLLLNEPRPARLVFTVQKEMADRMAARENTADYGPVSILCQAIGTVEVLRDLAPTVFWPRPQVHSSLVRIRPDDARIAAIGDIDLLRRVATGLFAHRRKTCLKSLDMTPELQEFHGRWPALLDETGIPHGVRGDTLAVEQVLTLARTAKRTIR
jgi:16S rRNA (adenine1518-N6/adenine1519-N6)-dimethyltransferase